MKHLHTIVERLRRLSETLNDLKERVRDAVAGELSRVVANTVQDVVHSFIRSKPEPPPREVPQERPSWQEDDPWAEEVEDYPVRREFEPEEVIPPPLEQNDRWQRALALGTTVLRWWLAGRWKPFLGLGVAGLAGAAAWWGGPAIHAGTGVVLSAAELIAFGTTHSLR
jgi:hypothetical protein